jgi:phosphatidate cytidylyltransferase
MLTRTIVSFVMMSASLYFLHLYQHLGWCLIIIALQTSVFRELVTLRYKEAREKDIPLFRTLQWTWFLAAMFWSYSVAWLKAPMGFVPFVKALKTSIRASKYLTDEWAVFDLIYFVLYSILIVVTVLSFRIGPKNTSNTVTKTTINLRFSYQLKQLSWTVLTVGFVVLQLKCMVYTTHAGLIWCVFPGSMIMMNDTSAYFCGMSFGKSIFKKWKFFPYLSPKKTWEGFIGGGVCTLLYAFYSVHYWGTFPGYRCSFLEINKAQQEGGPGLASLAPLGSCKNDHLFAPDSNLLFGASRMQCIAVGLALFASTVAPFGGFAASATKRAFNIKDFDSLIPGHGGFTDRMDCQFIMGMATWIAYTSFVQMGEFEIPVGRLIHAAQNLNGEDQRALVEAVQQMMANGVGR